MDEELRSAVFEASRQAPVRAAVKEIYASLQAAIDARRPKCSASGRCCRFDEFGHRLYVTTMELAAFVADLYETQANAESRILPDASITKLPQFVEKDSGGCRFQIDGLCSAHPFRPFGCRVFFCDETSTEWQYAQYDHYHARLRHLHEEMGVPYFYVEWRAALQALNLE